MKQMVQTAEGVYIQITEMYSWYEDELCESDEAFARER